MSYASSMVTHFSPALVGELQPLLGHLRAIVHTFPCRGDTATYPLLPLSGAQGLGAPVVLQPGARLCWGAQKGRKEARHSLTAPQAASSPPRKGTE